MIVGDASDFKRLQLELQTAVIESLPAARSGIQSGALLIKNAWQKNARATSGEHGKHYPSSITYDTRLLTRSAIGEIGPDSSRPQGGMGRGFEFGSRNQPPHLDGAKAASANEAKIETILTRAMDRVIP